jgi:myo-inositol 2-dehydrogenase / D-chiro-inositol 1-dehydrogenase
MSGISSKLRVAIAGCGGMGHRHTMLLGKAVPDAEVTLFVDPLPEAIDRIRQRNDLPAVPGVANLADPRFRELADAVIIATHHDLHPSLAIAAADAGKHIFIEKPLALTMGACSDIAAAVRRNNVQLVVGFQARHSPYVQQARQFIPQPRLLVGEMIDPKWSDDSWAQHPLTGGGNVLSQGVHSFDLLCYLAGSEPVSLSAEGGTFTHDPETTAVIDSVLATIRFANGAVASAVIGDFGPDPYTGKAFYQLFDAAGRSATVYGYYDGVRLQQNRQFEDFDGERVLRGKIEGFGHRGVTEETEPRAKPVSEAEAADPLGPLGYVGELREFVACARENRPPAISATVADGMRATQLALAAFESIRTGRTIQLKEQ